MVLGEAFAVLKPRFSEPAHEKPPSDGIRRGLFNSQEDHVLGRSGRQWLLDRPLCSLPLDGRE
jgi:hypothetical protein